MIYYHRTEFLLTYLVYSIVIDEFGLVHQVKSGINIEHKYLFKKSSAY